MENYSSSESSHDNDGGLTTNDRPSFFQLFLPEHNASTLRIPPQFLKNINPIPVRVNLKDLSGRIWPAKLEVIDENLHITKGWKTFVREHSPDRGEFLVFTYLVNSTFLVKAYGDDGLIKHEPREVKMYARIARGAGGTADVAADRNMLFYKTIGTKFKNFVGMPKDILDACSYKLPQSIELSDEKGVGVKTQLRQVTDRVVVGYVGLYWFWRATGVQLGDKLQFKVICGDGNKITGLVMKNISQYEGVRKRLLMTDQVRLFEWYLNVWYCLMCSIAYV